MYVQYSKALMRVNIHALARLWTSLLQMETDLFVEVVASAGRCRSPHTVSSI